MKDDFFQFLVATDTLDDFLGHKPRILSNKVQCVNCGDIIESKSENDYKKCSCGKVAIIGGKKYLKRIGNEEDYIELSEIEE